MSFRVAARTILELGAELISTDQIALYELIKNASDAGSKRANINIVTVYKFSQLRNVMQRLKATERAAMLAGRSTYVEVAHLCEEVKRTLDENSPAPDRTRFLELLGQPCSLQDFATRLQKAFDEVNRIEVADTGDGMTLRDLNDVFLMIGTRSRLDAGTGKHYVGGKGIGRLSAMRLGSSLEVRTAQEGEDHWNLLHIDWTIFENVGAGNLEEISVAPRRGRPKDSTVHGTSILIRGLKADWDKARVKRMADTYFDRLFDPFGKRARYPLVIHVNGSQVPIAGFDRQVYAEAQGRADITYAVDGPQGPRMTIEMHFTRHGREKTETLDRTDLLGITSNEDISVASFEALGPFTASFHWFNRQRIKAIDGWGDRERAKAVVNNWANGLLMYRDGFRVNPYGNPDDDWLGIDVKALSAGGYKLNRKQLLGAVYIGAKTNPFLIDQTNREGLRSNEEKQLLVLLMQAAITDRFKNFINAVEKEVKAATRIDVVETGKFLENVSSKLQRTMRDLLVAVPNTRREDVRFLQATFDELESRLQTARAALQTAERDYRDLIHLAGVGLQVEIVAHELGRVSRRTLETIGTMDRKHLPREVTATFDAVESQMLVIRKRLDVLNPLGPSSRQRRKEIDLLELLQQIFDSHEDQFGRNGISANIRVLGGRRGPVNVSVVPGMVVQVLENLLDNAVFWLKQKRRVDPAFSPEITVTLDVPQSQIRVTDNGPGIPLERAGSVFDAFVTSKPPGEGKGLGLYISRQIAHYHSGDLYLLNKPDDEDRLHTFVLTYDGS